MAQHSQEPRAARLHAHVPHRGVVVARPLAEAEAASETAHAVLVPCVVEAGDGERLGRKERRVERGHALLTPCIGVKRLQACFEGDEVLALRFGANEVVE